MDIPRTSSHSPNLLRMHSLAPKTNEWGRSDESNPPAPDAGPRVKSIPDTAMRVFVVAESYSQVSFSGACTFYYKNRVTDEYVKQIKVQIDQPQPNVIHFTSPEVGCVGAFEIDMTAYLPSGTTEPVWAKIPDKAPHDCWTSQRFPYHPSTAPTPPTAEGTH